MSVPPSRIVCLVFGFVAIWELIGWTCFGVSLLGHHAAERYAMHGDAIGLAIGYSLAAGVLGVMPVWERGNQSEGPR